LIPHLLELVGLLKYPIRILRKTHPRHLRPSEDRRCWRAHGSRSVERPRPNTTQRRSELAELAPERDVASWTAEDVLSAAGLGGDRDGDGREAGLGWQEGYFFCFDDSAETRRRSRFPLAV
jgi:hypothetical protein